MEKSKINGIMETKLESGQFDLTPISYGRFKLLYVTKFRSIVRTCETTDMELVDTLVHVIYFRLFEPSQYFLRKVRHYIISNSK